MIPHPPLLSPDYDGNYTPRNRRDWWVTLVAVVYKCQVYTFEPFCLHNEGVRYQFDTSPPLLTPAYGLPPAYPLITPRQLLTP